LRFCHGDLNTTLNMANSIEGQSQGRNLMEIQFPSRRNPMWRPFLLASTSAIVLAGTALAADLPVTPPPPPPIFSWTGPYAGGYGGGEVTRTSYNTVIGFPSPAFSHLAPADIAVVDAGEPDA
jgi:hypothetical protein